MRDADQGDVVVPAAEAAALKVVKPKFFLELLMRLLAVEMTWWSC